MCPAPLQGPDVDEQVLAIDLGLPDDRAVIADAVSRTCSRTGTLTCHFGSDVPSSALASALSNGAFARE